VTYYENTKDFVLKLRDTLYSLAYTSSTSTLKIDDLINYIKENISEYNLIISKTHPDSSSKIIGCLNEHICISQQESLINLNLNNPMKIQTVFDFYDIVSRLEEENRITDIEDAIKNFDIMPAYENSITELNELGNKLIELDTKNITIYRINNLSIDAFYDELFYKAYKNYLLTIFEFYDVYQQFEILFKALLFLSKYSMYVENFASL
jgi:hypothetical protein